MFFFYKYLFLESNSLTTKYLSFVFRESYFARK